ncbi:hypothetical protein CLU79DRAFT_841922 [Phycomyces nitens]|nr:hypothetical protein CLU79DRAFT_841922 [Phycomyces nitens]
MPSTRSHRTERDTLQNYTQSEESDTVDDENDALSTEDKDHPIRVQYRNPNAEKHQELAQQFMEILLKGDGHGLLSEDESDQANPITVQVIKHRLEIGEYIDLQAFKHDLDQLFQVALERIGSSREKRDELAKLYQSYISTLRLETTRLKKRLGEQDIMEDDVVFLETTLFRPTPDGFVFADAVPNKAKDSSLPANVQELAVHPTPPSAFDPPPLKSTVSLPPRFPPKIFRHEDKHVVPIQWLDYGAFSSFAPACDSHNANVSYESTYMGRAAKRFRRWEKKQRNLQTLGRPPSHPKHSQRRKDLNHHNHNHDHNHNHNQQQPSPQPEKPNGQESKIDTDWLKDQGLDVDTILEASENGTFSVDDILIDNDQDLDAVLERNGQLLEQLLECQEYRFGLGDARWAKTDEKEKEIAQTLQIRLHSLLNQITPKDITNPQDVQYAMNALPLLETAYRGSLPPNKPFAFPTTDKAEPLPPYANITPTYAKERWRLIDVMPMPMPMAPKPNNGTPPIGQHQPHNSSANFAMYGKPQQGWTHNQHQQMHHHHQQQQQQQQQHHQMAPGSSHQLHPQMQQQNRRISGAQSQHIGSPSPLGTMPHT